MPAKDSICKFHGRHVFLSRSLWRKYKRETGDKIDYQTFRQIILSSMDEVQKWVLKEPIGFQISPKIGNLTVNKFTPPQQRATIWNNGRAIPTYNLHTGGSMFRVQWFHGKTSHKSRLPYWFFVPDRDFNRSLAKVLKSGTGPNFNSFMQNHFVNNKEWR